MFNRLFREYLYLHKEISIFLNSIIDTKYKITNNVVFLSIHVINQQLQLNRSLTKEEVMSNKLIPITSYYRTLDRCIEMNLISVDKQWYKFTHEIPPHLKTE